MISLLVQILTLLCALVVNFAVPALFGLTEYGLFLQANILVFVFQKLTDIANEPLISKLHAPAIFPVSLCVSGGVLIVFAVVNLLYPLGSALLLGAMLLSSCVLLSMYAMRQTKRILVYLCAFLSMFSVSIVLNLTKVYEMDIQHILILTNLVPALVAAVFLIPSSRVSSNAGSLVEVVLSLWKSVPSMLSLTLVYNLFTNIFPFLLSKTLPADSLGLFRVVASLVQSATSFFPLNIKTIFVALVRSDERERHYTTIMSFSLCYFAAAGLATYALVTVFPKFQPYTALVCSLPVLYWAVLSERYLLAMNKVRYVRTVNVLVGISFLVAMFFVENVHQAILCYALGFSLYAALLLNEVSKRICSLAAIWVCGLAPLAALNSWHTALPALIYLIGCLALALGIIRFNLNDLRALKETL